jgi:hypothetical protein
MKRILLSIFAGMLVCALTCSSAWAQATAQISGTAKDQSAAVLPGVEIHVIQAETGITRDTITNETGSYVLPNLPIGPYRLEASLPGFRTYAQTGIVLQVNSNPTINIVLEVGQVAETVEVQANAALVETRSAGIGQVVENARILELPLNGRAVVELISLAGAANPAPPITGADRDPFGKGNVSVAGGFSSGLNYTLDGANHNNQFDNGYMSMPFPDALQEFKVETSAMGAQNGVKSAGSVSLVTKAGTNEFHGNLFEFVRNGMFNARNAFATARDTIKRNQFGGTFGGAILKNKLFFFSAYQGTTIRQDPSDVIAFVPTAAILAGDFSAFASPACNAGRQITLRAPFVNNRVDPALFSRPAVLLAGKIPRSSDPCGKIIYGNPNIEDGHMAIGRIDYQRSANHSVFGRYLLESVVRPAPYSLNKNLLSTAVGTDGLAQAFTLGDTYLFGANIVNAIRLTANRMAAGKFAPDVSAAGAGPTDTGVKAFTYEPHNPAPSVTGGFATGFNGGGPTRNATFAGSDDLSVVRGNHQLAFGASGAAWWTNSYTIGFSRMTMSFNGQTTGLGMADYFMGNAASFRMGNPSSQHKWSKYFGMYGADTWKLTPKLTLNYGLRWEPYFPTIHRDTSAIHYDHDAFAKGIKTTRFTNAPPGVFFNGDPGFQGGKAGMNAQWWNFSPRVGLAWDLAGDGRTSIRVSGGTFYDFPNTFFWNQLSNDPPFNPQITRTNVSFENPWAGYPGGDPFPMPFGRKVARDVAWPLYGTVLSFDYDTPNMQVTQWNFSLQKQISTDWLLSGSYMGNATRHLWSMQNINLAVYLPGGPCTLAGVTYNPCSTTGNIDQRRRLTLENPQTGQYIGNIPKLDSGGKASYNGLLLSLQRRAARGITVSGNYTWSHCITDPGGDKEFNAGGIIPWLDPNDRRRDRGNCFVAATDRRHIFNLSAVAETPQFSNPTLRAVGSGWRFSPIVKILSGAYMSITTNQDRALSGNTSQRVDQVLPNVYGDKSVSNYFNPAAFALPALGTLGNTGKGAFAGPGTWQFDAALSRTFQVRESQKVEFRAEAFNVTNSFHMNDPELNLNSNTFGQVTSAKDPRIMQFALKYLF